jgi:hypothetical protein
MFVFFVEEQCVFHNDFWLFYCRLSRESFRDFNIMTGGKPPFRHCLEDFYLRTAYWSSLVLDGVAGEQVEIKKDE